MHVSTWQARLLVRAKQQPLITHRAVQTFSAHPASMSSGQARVLRSEALPDGDAKWVGLRAIFWQDPTGKERKWESADRRTRKGDVDAVAICAVIERPSAEPHLLLVSQFRPPVDASVVEMPAGLVDAGEEGDEGAQRAAMRELEEETGYGTEREGGKTDVQLVSDIMVNDPGMSGANMKLCVVRIQLADDTPEPVAKPDEGEFIEKHLVPVRGLLQTLQGLYFAAFFKEPTVERPHGHASLTLGVKSSPPAADFRNKGLHVDARLAHLAVGIELGLGKLGSSKI